MIHLFVHLRVAMVCLETAFDHENNCYLTCPDLRVHIPDFTICGMQGWRSGESTRLPPMWPRFGYQIRHHMWVEFVRSLLCRERLSPGAPVSPLLKNHVNKNTFPSPLNHAFYWE